MLEGYYYSLFPTIPSTQRKKTFSHILMDFIPRQKSFTWGIKQAFSGLLYPFLPTRRTQLLYCSRGCLFPHLPSTICWSFYLNSKVQLAGPSGCHSNQGTPIWSGNKVIVGFHLLLFYFISQLFFRTPIRKGVICIGYPFDPNTVGCDWFCIFLSLIKFCDRTMLTNVLQLP